MTALRMRMDNDMLVRGMAERTRETYIGAVARLARFTRRSPDQLSPQQVQAYLVHMIWDEKLAWSTCSIAVQAFRFLYRTPSDARNPSSRFRHRNSPRRSPRSSVPPRCDT